MFNCTKDINAYHNKEVNLPVKERDNMRKRRNSNRDRLRNGLEKEDNPKPIEFVSQGSYAMKTMIQDPDKNYDIDDGVYFHKEELIGSRGGELSSRQARDMVCDALDDGQFNQAPEVRSNCVRVYYEAGYHVDIPVYRRIVVTDVNGDEVDVYYELASSSGWKRSDARDVTKWYKDELSKSLNGDQLRRINRLLKHFARSRNSWRDSILCGFGISVLVVECFQANDREDRALYETMVAIRNRLQWNLQIAHPVTPNDYITKGVDDAQARFFRDKLTDAINELQQLFEHDCTREQALKCWDKVFYTAFFCERLEDERRASSSTSNTISAATLAGLTSNGKDAVRDTGSGRFA